MAERKVLVIYTGGTMGMIFDPQRDSLVPYNVKDIIVHVPELSRLVTQVEFITFEKPLDSSNMKPWHWVKMAEIIYENYQKYDGFVILHGTDTMAYSASALSFLLENLSKPVIFTGAQLPISEVRSDARENFITAIEIAGAENEGKPVVSEVCIYFDKFLFRGNRARKVQSSHFDAFMSENYPPLAEAGVTIDFNNSCLLKPGDGELRMYKNLTEDIAILTLFPGISEKVVDSIISYEGIKGIILETFGSGNAPTDSWLIRKLKDSICDHKKVVLNVSQCVGGRVEQGRYETSRLLQKIGVISGGSMTTEAALTKMMFVLGNEPYKEDVANSLTKSLRGEME